MIDDVTKDRVRGRRQPDIIQGAKENNLREVKRAVRHSKENLNQVESFTGFTALHYAVARGNLSIVNFLLEQSVIELQTADIHERTPLELAVEIGHQGVISALLKARAARE